GSSGQIDLEIVSGAVSDVGAGFDPGDASVVIADVEVSRPEEMEALGHLMHRIGHWPPVVGLTQSFDADAARRMLQMKIADFLVKPVPPVELVRTCARVARPSVEETTEAQIYTFLPAVGGAGVTTLAVQTAMLLMNSGSRGPTRTCLVDLDFQHGACTDHL